MIEYLTWFEHNHSRWTDDKYDNTYRQTTFRERRQINHVSTIQGDLNQFNRFRRFWRWKIIRWMNEMNSKVRWEQYKFDFCGTLFMPNGSSGDVSHIIIMTAERSATCLENRSSDDVFVWCMFQQKNWVRMAWCQFSLPMKNRAVWRWLSKWIIFIQKTMNMNVHSRNITSILWSTNMSMHEKRLRFISDQLYLPGLHCDTIKGPDRQFSRRLLLLCAALPSQRQLERV